MLLSALAMLAACIPETDGLQSDIYEICYRDLPATLERTANDAAGGRVVVDDVDFGDAIVENASVGLATLRVDAATGTEGFGFVRAAHVEVVNERILELSSGSAELYGEADSPPNLLEHMAEDSLELRLVLEGDAPPSSLRVRVDACFDVDGIAVELQ